MAKSKEDIINPKTNPRIVQIKSLLTISNKLNAFEIIDIYGENVYEKITKNKNPGKKFRINVAVPKLVGISLIAIFALD
jgi:hypothetical protein